MSNVRPRANQMRSMLLQAAGVQRSAVVQVSSSRRSICQQLRCIGAGRPSVGGRRTVLSCQGLLQHRLGLSVLWRPAHQRVGSGNMHRPNGGLCSAAVPSWRQSVNRSLPSNSLNCAAACEANANANASLGSHGAVGAGPLVAQAAQRIKIGARSVLLHARPNPSVEGTCSSGLRPLPHAPHVKR